METHQEGIDEEALTERGVGREGGGVGREGGGVG